MRRALRWTLAGAAGALGVLVYVYLTLPDVRPLATANPTTSAFIQLRAEEARRAGRRPRRHQRWVRYEQVSTNLRRAVLVAEDSAFWKHGGIDVEQIRQSIEVNLSRGTFVRGGSTITQQLAKNLYLSPARTPTRKLRELMIARRLEAELTKRRILELYLNLIEWGDGIYGAEAAARRYFRKPASALSPREAALLAGAIVNPRILSPAKPGSRLRWRQRLILARMGEVTPPAPAPPFTVPPFEPLPLDPSFLPGTPLVVPEPAPPGSGEPPPLPESETSPPPAAETTEESPAPEPAPTAP
jgi:monofunctional biosynthetic peptidoglycan transglycosylase